MRKLLLVLVLAGCATQERIALNQACADGNEAACRTAEAQALERAERTRNGLAMGMANMSAAMTNASQSRPVSIAPTTTCQPSYNGAVTCRSY